MLMAQERHRMSDVQSTRRDWQSRDQLLELAKALREEAAKLDAQATATHDLGMDEVFIDGVTKADRGLLLVREFVGNVQIALIKGRVRKADTRKRIRRSS
jgi:hypothetical protein